MKKFLGITLAAIVLISIRCTDGSIIGNDLLEDEAIQIEYDDSFILSGRTVKGDSVATFREGLVSNTYLLGQIDEPTFGKYSSDIYTGIAYGSSLPDFEDSSIDSIVLELEYDSLGFYGSDQVVHNIEVFTVEEDWLNRDTIYSDESLDISMLPIGSKSFIPDFRGDSIRFQVRDSEIDSFITLSPRISIPLDNAFGQLLLDDTDAAENDTLLTQAFKGIYIRSTTEGNSMIGLNFLKSGTISTIIPKVAVYYTQLNDEGEEVKRTYNYLLRDEVHSQYFMDYTGSSVGSALGSEIAGEEFIYTQGMAGVNGEVIFPDLSHLNGNLINSAQLVLTISEEDMDLYPENFRFLLSKYGDDGERVLIEDIVKDGLSTTNGLDILGGFPTRVLHENGDSITTVTFNITDFTRNNIETEDSPDRLVISPVGRVETPRRTIFFGAKHPTYPAKLKIAYTII